MAQQQTIIACLNAFFGQDVERIRGAVLFGSFGRGKGTSVSDIDIELLVIDHQIDIEKFTNDIIQLFTNADESLVVKHTLWLSDQHKLALYHGPQLLLTELYLYTELSQFDKYFLGSRITDLDKCILLDRENRIRPHLEHILTLPYDDRPGLIRNLVNNIQFLLESSSSARQRGDAYKFYFLSNITLHELVRLAYVLDGKMEYNYNPPTSNVNPDLASTMDLNKARLHFRQLIDFFFQQLDRIPHTETDILDKARHFCQCLLNRNC